MEIEKELKQQLTKANKILDAKMTKFYNGQKDLSFIEFEKFIASEKNDVLVISRKLRLIKSFILKPLSDYGSFMTLKQFKEHVEDGLFIDYDGSGNYATYDEESNISIYPSDILSGMVRDDFTHVMWYNK